MATPRTLPRHSPHHQAGLTLVELAVVMAMTAILLGQALPALGQMLRLQALRGAAAELESDLQLARSQAVLRNAPMRVTFGGAAADSTDTRTCYLLHTGPADACHCGDGQPPRCEGSATLLRAVVLDPQRLAPLQTGVRSVLADPQLGTLSPTVTLRLATADGQARLRVVANILGRVRACADATPVSGFQPCD